MREEPTLQKKQQPTTFLVIKPADTTRQSGQHNPVSSWVLTISTLIFHISRASRQTKNIVMKPAREAGYQQTIIHARLRDREHITIGHAAADWTLVNRYILCYKL